jgi:hypothetical protein
MVAKIRKKEDSGSVSVLGKPCAPRGKHGRAQLAGESDGHVGHGLGSTSDANVSLAGGNEVGAGGDGLGQNRGEDTGG